MGVFSPLIPYGRLAGSWSPPPKPVRLTWLLEHSKYIVVLSLLPRARSCVEQKSGWLNRAALDRVSECGYVTK
jgi:hypothetical protein